jgi:drug/metabolite transporter (DMT)-like permease
MILSLSLYLIFVARKFGLKLRAFYILLLHFLIFSLFFSLKYINVAMLTILKNVANVLTASGETYFFKKQHGTQVWIALLLMVCHIISSYVRKA